jgi:glycerophosphoryl diester phosphodiesterase
MKYSPLVIFILAIQCTSCMSDADSGRPTEYPAPWSSGKTHPSYAVVAHRGGSAYSPENTLLAVVNSARSGIDAIEIDVLLSSDGEVILNHDFTLQRTTDCAGEISTLSSRAIASCDAAFWWRAGMPETTAGPSAGHLRDQGIRVATLSEVLASGAIPNQGYTQIFIDLKIPPGNSFMLRAELLISRVIEEIYKTQFTGNVVITSGDSRVLTLFRSMASQISTALIHHAAPDSRCEVALRDSIRIGATYLILDWAAASRADGASCMSMAKDSGIKVYVSRVREISQMYQLLDMKVDGIMTGWPSCLLALLGRVAPRNPYPPMLKRGEQLPKCPTN